MARVLVVHGFPWVDECYGRFPNLYYLLYVDFNETQCFESCLEYNVQGIQLPDYPHCITKTWLSSKRQGCPIPCSIVLSNKSSGELASGVCCWSGSAWTSLLRWCATVLCITCSVNSFIIIIIIILSSFSVLLNCLYLSPQVSPFSSFVPHHTGGQWANSWVVLNCCHIEPQCRHKSTL